MYNKQKISFNTVRIFGRGFKPDLKYSFNIVAEKLLNEAINLDGTIDINKSIRLSISDLWCYIYYLYINNQNNIDEFNNMRLKGKANAVLFYNEVFNIFNSNNYDVSKNVLINKNEVQPLNATVLIHFINYIINKYNEKLVNPIFDQLKKLLERHGKNIIDGITIKTGLKNGNVDILTGNAIKNADIKISFYKKN
jgi:hypothetical protein